VCIREVGCLPVDNEMFSYDLQENESQVLNKKVNNIITTVK